MSAGKLSELQGWDILDSLQEAASGAEVYPDVRGGSGDISTPESLTIDPAVLVHPPSGRAGQLPDSAPGGQDDMPDRLVT